MSDLNTQDQLITSLITALNSRRCAPTYSTAYHWNQRMLVLSNTLLETANSSLTTLLRRIIRNAQWFQSHYRAGLSTLQQLQATEDAVAQRQRLADVFERDRGVRLDVGRAMDAQGERQELELRNIEALMRGPGRGAALGSHPVSEKEGGEGVERGGRKSTELQFRLTPPEGLMLRLELELEIQEKVRAGRGAVIEGVDEDMILAYWASNPEIGVVEIDEMDRENM